MSLFNGLEVGPIVVERSESRERVERAPVFGEGSGESGVVPGADETDVRSRRFPSSSLLFAAFCLGLLLVLCWIPRANRKTYDRGEDGVYFHDPDTVRRLHRLEKLQHLEQGYPFRNRWDGFPQGSVLHWTRPMDWVLWGLDPLFRFGASATLPRFEVGAMWAGPVLGVLSVLVFFLFCQGWLGRGRAWLAAALYGLSSPMIVLGSSGNGDHQNLQHLFLLLAFFSSLSLVRQRFSSWIPFGLGISTGLALWVSTESLAFWLLLAGVTGGLSLRESEARRRWLRAHFTAAISSVAVCLLAERIEHSGSDLSFEWDQISWFQIIPLLVFSVFLGMTLFFDRRRWIKSAAVGGAVSAGAALLVGLAPFALFPSLRNLFGDQIALFQGSQAWAKSSIVEYTPLFGGYGSFEVRQAAIYFSVVIYLFPLFLVGLLTNRELKGAERVLLGIVALGGFGLTCKETKLAHLFMMSFPLVVVLGGEALFRRGASLILGARKAKELVLWSCGGAALLVVVIQGPEWHVAPGSGDNPRVSLMQAVRDLPPGNSTGEEESVLALWSFGAELMHYGKKPVVGSNYHRNLEGIHDSFRGLLGRRWDEVEPVLRKHRVRWILTHAKAYAPMSFVGVEEMLPELGSFVKPTIARDPGTGKRRLAVPLGRLGETLYWQLQTKRMRDPRFELEYESHHTLPLVLEGRRRPWPVFLVYRVHYPEELRG